MWQRYNQTTHIFEKSVDDGVVWTPLGLNASIITEGVMDPARLPPATPPSPYTALTNVDNPWTVAQQKLPSHTSILGSNSVFWLDDTSAPANQRKWRAVGYSSGVLYWERFSATNVHQGSGPAFLNDGGLSVPLDILGGRNLSLAGGQIYFPSTQVPTTTANALDDYEEGLWTPLLGFGGSGAEGAAYTGQLGSYTKIGRKVTVCFHLAVSNKATRPGAMFVHNLPFAPANLTEMVNWNTVYLYGAVGNALAGGVIGQVQPGLPWMNIYTWVAAPTGLHTQVYDSHMNVSFTMQASATYFTTS